MPRLAPAALLLIAAAAVLPAAAQQPDRQTAQQLRRFQLQAQQAQQQLQEVQAAKVKLEAENAELRASLGAQQREAGAATSARRALDQKLRSTETERSTLAGTIADLELRLADEKKRGAGALAAKDRELAQAAQAQHTVESRETDLQARFREQVRLVGECSEKNDRLVKVGAELVGRYRDKGFADLVRGREPLLGLGDVATFNLIQDYRDQLDAARFTRSVTP